MIFKNNKIILPLFWILVFPVQNVNALVGITINNMYVPDSCGAACFSYFSSFQLDCSTTDLMGMVDSSSDCLGSNKDYMNSVAWCWDLQCSDKSRSHATNYDFVKAWNKNMPNTTYTYQDALSWGKPTEILSSSASNLNMTHSALVNDTDFYILYRTNKDFIRSESVHARMALSLVMMSWALVLFEKNAVSQFN
ncbi:unnamed protein product [Ambrosiozyma monospora]|uniref:Unnamed protein product n=1 Tax=Ambrosiozyma monospora TaxID=43982 RepID=A0ACB5T7K8_AMBMO|nr:unnamed protein product [Ambrosiozyma monospora]